MLDSNCDLDTANRRAVPEAVKSQGGDTDMASDVGG
jgi:hypothetical protein